MRGSIYDRITIPESFRAVAIERDQAVFLESFLEEVRPERTLEVGLGLGCSAACILHATGRPHVAIDPLQRELFHDAAISNLRKLGLVDRLVLLHERSQLALPRLVAEGRRFDFALIDGDHKLDSVFVDFYFCDLLLEPGGHLFFDDTWMRSVQLVTAFIETNRKDYQRLEVPAGNTALLRKVGKDERSWDHFEEICRSA